MAIIIVVDDEPHMRAILTANLQQDGHVVLEANGLATAKNAISGNEYDVVITDHKMPDGSGIDVLNLVRQDDPTASVIFLTAVGLDRVGSREHSWRRLRLSYQAIPSRGDSRNGGACDGAHKAASRKQPLERNRLPTRRLFRDHWQRPCDSESA